MESSARLVPGMHGSTLKLLIKLVRIERKECSSPNPLKEEGSQQQNRSESIAKHVAPRLHAPDLKACSRQSRCGPQQLSDARKRIRTEADRFFELVVAFEDILNSAASHEIGPANEALE